MKFSTAYLPATVENHVDIEPCGKTCVTWITIIQFIFSKLLKMSVLYLKQLYVHFKWYEISFKIWG